MQATVEMDHLVEVHFEIQIQQVNYTNLRLNDNRFPSKHKCSNNNNTNSQTMKVTLLPNVAQLSLTE